MNFARSTIVRWVLLGHAAVIGLLWVSGSISDWLQPEREVIPVQMVSEVDSAAADTAEDEGKDASETGSNERRPEPEAADEAQTKDQPEIEASPSSQESPQKTVSEPVQEDVTEEAVQTSQQQKNEWQARSADDIRKNAQLDSAAQDANTGRNRSSKPIIDTAEFAQRLESKLDSISVEDDDGGEEESPNGKITAEYRKAVGTLLRQRWQEPSALILDGDVGNPTLKLVIRNDGKVEEAWLTGSSGNAIVDNSVKRLLKRIKKIPAPSQYGVSIDNPFEVMLVVE